MPLTLSQPVAAAVLLSFLVAGCGDGSTGPKTGILEVTIQTTGGDLDIDGFVILVDSNRQSFTFGNTARDIRDLTAGTHTVTLQSVAENCAVQGSLPRSVIVPADQVVTVSFEVVCVATAIAVRTHVTGSDIQRSYQLTLNGGPAGNVDADSSVVFGRLQPGSYTVALSAAGQNCSVTSADHVAVDVSPRTTTPVLFEINCSPAVRSEEIAFTMDTVIHGLPQTWVAVVRPDGSGMTRIALGNSPSWSPDGTRLVYSTAVCTTDSYYGYTTCAGGLAVIDPETRNVDPVNGPGTAFSPSWSPRADLIAFAGCCVSAQPDGIYVIAADAGRPLVRLAAHGTSLARDPAWSPDGDRIALTCMVQSNKLDVCVMNGDGTALVRLTNDSTSDYRPAWSPDGKLIAFQAVDQVAVIPAAGGNITRLTRGFHPAWSRDGTRLVFGDINGLYTMNADGSNRTRLTAGQHYAPAWRP